MRAHPIGHRLKVDLQVARNASQIHAVDIHAYRFSTHLGAFESRYEMSLDQFERDHLPRVDMFDAHESYNDWTFWQRVADETRQPLKRFRRLDLP